MKKAETRMDDDLRPEYDLESLRVRKVGPKRKTFRGQPVQLDPDVAAMVDSEPKKRESVYTETEVSTLKGHGIDLDMLAEDYDILVLLRMLKQMGNSLMRAMQCLLQSI